MDEDTFWRLLAKLQGAAAVALGIAVGAAIVYFTGWQIVALAVGCLVAAALDVYFRLHSFAESRWIDADSGANIANAPVYILSAVAFVIGLLLILRVI